MKTTHRFIFLILVVTLLQNWLISFHLGISHLIPLIVGIVAAGLVSVVLARRLNPSLSAKMKYQDRNLFINDLVKTAKESEFVFQGQLENHIFFVRHHYFPPIKELLHLKFQEDNECLLVYPQQIEKLVKKHLGPYITLREREFLKETDQLMKET